MAAEYIVVNPSHRRRGRKARRSRSRSRTHRRRRRHVMRANPPRRRRHVRHLRRRYRRHHNPSLGGGNMVRTLTTGLGVGGGAIATKIGAGFISKYLPANFQTGIGATAVKAAVGLVALPMVLRLIPGGKRFATPVMLGAGVVVALDLFTMYLAEPVGKAIGVTLSDYSPGLLADYGTGVLEGYSNPMVDEDASVGNPLSGTIYEGGIYN